MEWGFLPMIFIATVQSTPPLLIAGLGELITEKSGVLNLGVEGMMLVGAVFAFIVAFITDSFWLGATAGIGAGIVMAALFALLTVFLRANQVACGLALTIFGAGFSAFVGLEYEGKSLTSPPAYKIPFLGDIPVLGPMLFNYQVPVYFAVLLLSVTVWFLLHTRAGLILRAVGENHHAAGKMGYPVSWIRFVAVIYGGALCGLAGAYLSIFYTPLWAQNMTAGRGWIVLALVVFASWRPWRLRWGRFCSVLSEL